MIIGYLDPEGLVLRVFRGLVSGASGLRAKFPMTHNLKIFQGIVFTSYGPR